MMKRELGRSGCDSSGNIKPVALSRRAPTIFDLEGAYLMLYMLCLIWRGADLDTIYVTFDLEGG